MTRAIAYAAVAVGLALGGLTSPAPASAAPLPAEASVWSPSGVFEKGAQRHAYRYEVETAEAYWSLEIFVYDSRGRQIAFDNQTSGADPSSARASFRFWSQATRPGRFTIKTKLSWGDYDREERWLEPRTFRLRRP
jgi:hypothetical protein